MFKELVHKADLGNGYYMNPILDGDYADPAVFREGEDYYLTVSTGELPSRALYLPIPGFGELEADLPSAPWV